MRNMQTEVSQLKVLSYLVEQLDEYTEVILERRPQEDGSERWAIYKGRFCLGKTEAYLELVKPEITQHNAELICQRVMPEQLETWKGTLTLWAESGWNRNNFSGMFERFETRVNTERVKAKTGGQLFGKPAVVSPTAQDYAASKGKLL